MSEYFNRLRTEKELIKLREAKSDWRKELKNNDHPYVDVMPSADQKQKDAEKKVKEEDKKKEEERKREEKEIKKEEKEGWRKKGNYLKRLKN